MILKDDGVFVVTDRQFGAFFTGFNVRVGDRVVVVTTRDDATEAERDQARKRAADIVRARTGGTADV